MDSTTVETKIQNGEYTLVKKLNAREIEEIEALEANRVGAERAFNTAFNFYMNRLSTNKLAIDDFYRRMTGESNFSPIVTIYTVANIEGFASVVKVENS